MEACRGIALLVFVLVLLRGDLRTSEGAQVKHIPSQRAAQAAQQTSSPRAAQSRHQWSADPERGWVRGDEADATDAQRAATKRRDPGRHPTRVKNKKL